MKSIYLLRHAKAQKDVPGLPDFARPLTSRGQEDARKFAQKLKKEGIVFDRVLSSPAQRAKETLAFLLPDLSFPLTRVEYRDELYSATEKEIIALLSALDTGSSVLVCGHNPALESLATLWAEKQVELSTCSCFCAHFSFNSWDRLPEQRPNRWEYIARE
ncbi:MAG: histidine phosphatase family protein [Spirochaetales bacterium]